MMLANKKNRELRVFLENLVFVLLFERIVNALAVIICLAVAIYCFAKGDVAYGIMNSALVLLNVFIIADAIYEQYL